MLTKCPECGRDISDTAVACPACGFGLQQPPNPADRFKNLKSYHVPKASQNPGRTWIILAALAVVGVGGLVVAIGRLPPSTSSEQDRSIPEPWLQDMAKRYAGPYLSLRDPDSAVYTDTTYRTRHGEPIICGFVNAKNAFGGNVGPRAFIVGHNETLIQGRTPSAKFKKTWQTECVETDHSEQAAAKFTAPSHPVASVLSASEAEAKIRPLLHLEASDTAQFSQVTYRTRYRMPITCGRVSVNGAASVAFISTPAGTTRADTADGQARTQFPQTWHTLCVETDAMQDAEDRATGHGRH